MGQKFSIEEQRNRKEYIYAYFPGLSQQLDMTFSCHDLEHNGKLHYSILEPILRHLLMQYGLIEYITRFIDSEGKLDLKHVKAEARKFGVGSETANYNCEDFKSFAVVWLQKILDTYADDQATYQAKMRAEQKSQVEDYMNAMKTFQDQYSYKEALYQQGLKEQQKQIQEWNQLLEETHRTQQEVYEAEVRKMEELKQKEANAQQIANEEHYRIITEYKNQLKSMASTDTNGICFVYPATCCPYGACASAGSQEPCRRKKIKQKSDSKKLVQGLC